MYVNKKTKAICVLIRCFVKEKFNIKKFLLGVDNTVITVYTVYEQLSSEPVAVSCMYMEIKSANNKLC